MSRLVVWMPRLASWASLALALGVVKAILARPTCQKTGYGCPTGAGVIHCTRVDLGRRAARAAGAVVHEVAVELAPRDAQAREALRRRLGAHPDLQRADRLVEGPRALEVRDVDHHVGDAVDPVAKGALAAGTLDARQRRSGSERRPRPGHPRSHDGGAVQEVAAPHPHALPAGPLLDHDNPAAHRGVRAVARRLD